MKTFTVRALNRDTSGILAVVDAEGAVEIRSARTHRTYRIICEGRPSKLGKKPDYSAIRQKLFGDKKCAPGLLEAAEAANRG